MITKILFLSACFFAPFFSLKAQSLQSNDSYRYLLLARSDYNDTYNVEAGTLFWNKTPVILDSGEVCIVLSAYRFEALQAIWCSLQAFIYAEINNARGNAQETAKETAQENVFEEIYYVAQENEILTDIALSADGKKLSFEKLNLDGFSLGIFSTSLIDFQTSRRLQVQDVVFESGLKAAFVSEPTLSQGDLLSFRVKSIFLDTAVLQQKSDKSLRFVAVDSGIQQSSPYSYLFSPSVNSNGALAFKARYGKAGEWAESQPDRILYFPQETLSPELVAEDRDAQSGSMFESFRNGVVLNDRGDVVFVANMATVNRACVVFVKWDEFLKKFQKPKCLLLEGDLISGLVLTAMDTFAPVMNAAGNIALRVELNHEVSAIIAIESLSGSAQVLIKEGDEVISDLGPSVITRSEGHSSAFSAGLAMNEKGDVAFVTQLYSLKAQKNIGMALIKAIPNN